jgi:hypothetical protein
MPPERYEVGDRVICTGHHSAYTHYCVVGNIYEVIGLNSYNHDNNAPVHRLRGQMGGDWEYLGSGGENTVPEADFELVENRPPEVYDEMRFFKVREQPQRNYKEI